MFKHFFSILLILVMAFSMTACGSTSTDNQLTTIEETTEANLDNFNISTLKIDLINVPLLTEMTQEQITSIMEEMVNISSTEKLSISDMIFMGHNFNNIITFVPSVNVNDFEIQVIKAFDNVYNQSLEQQIPLEKLSSWTNIPVAEIQLKYFSGEFFDVEDVNCKALYTLKENDAVMVAETIFSNPALFEQSAFMIYDAIMCPYSEVQNIGLSVLTQISQTSQPIDSSIAFNICRILDTNDIINDTLTFEKINQIRKNIIENEHFDFVAKYLVFCNSSNEEVSNWAHASLLKVAKEADKETSSSIMELVNYLSNEEICIELLTLLEGN